VDRIITRLGLADHDPKLLHDRRGTTVYKIDDLALKITTGLMAGREGDVLRLLGTEFYRDHGWDGERSWLTLRWIDGTTLWTALEEAHRGDDRPATRRGVLAWTAHAARALAGLHAAGWAHGDLQPDHVLFEGDITHLIDLACAQGPAEVPFYVHRGGLAHTTAPEIAEAILASDEHVVATPQADVWSLGASLWWSWTRTPPIAYSDPAAKRAGQLADIAAVRRAPATARPWPFPAFEDAVMACLAADPADRPTAKELATSLP
jgi:serine/threonine protein kinase